MAPLPSHSCRDVRLSLRNEMLPATVSWQLQGADFQTSLPRSSEQMLLSAAPVPELEVRAFR